jgi:glycosyltransferase involved in cell wall biosynthesis
MAMNDIKVSIIVPVYNVEPYLSRSLDSLVNQTLSDIEIICINDCSQDKSLVILKEYAKKDKRIKIIDFEKNQGVSAARNSGMKIAKGEYLGFCDPDDYVDLDFYEKLYKLAKNKTADIAKGARKRMEIDSNEEVIESLNELILKHKCYFTYQFTTAIYRNKILKKHKIRFPKGKITSEDICFLVHAVIEAKSIYVLNNTFYHYIRRDNSANSDTYSSEKAYSTLSSFCIILDHLNKAAEKDKNYMDRYMDRFYNFFHLLAKNSENRVIKKIVELSFRYYPKYKFPIKKIKLPKPIVAAIENKNKKELISLLQKWVYCEFYPFISIKKSILQTRKLYVWGTGEDGIKVKKQCENNGWKISGFLDSNKSIKKYYEYKVVSPEQILNKPKRDFFIIISSRKYSREIAGICRKSSLKKGKDFWCTHHGEL